MHPDDDFIEMVSVLLSSFSSSPFHLPLCISFCLTWGLGS
jgi:hypothetical protein